MAKIIISVMFEGSNKLRDYEVPADITSGELVEKLVKQFGYEKRFNPRDYGFQLIVAGSYRFLDWGKTLEEEGIYDGALLIVHPYHLTGIDRKTAVKKADSQASGWESLSTLYSKEREKTGKFRATTKFVWKKE